MGLARFELATSSLSVIIVLVSEHIGIYHFEKVNKYRLILAPIIRLHDHWKEVKDWSCYCKNGNYFFNDEAGIKYYKSIGDPWFDSVEI